MGCRDLGVYGDAKRQGHLQCRLSCSPLSHEIRLRLTVLTHSVLRNKNVDFLVDIACALKSRASAYMKASIMCADEYDFRCEDEQRRWQDVKR